MEPCVYVTSGWGIHDERWTTALRSIGFTPHIVRLGIDVLDASDPGELRSLVAEYAGPNIPVLAGPLDTVTSLLAGLEARVIGLSWGFDLHRMNDATWLPQLAGVIIDSQATAQLAIQAGVNPEAITFLPWGVDLEVFNATGPTSDMTHWGVPPGARALVSLRAHEPLYRVGDILDAFARITDEFQDAHLVIGNSGSLTNELREQVRSRGIEERTHFIGSLAESELPPLLRAASAYVSASEVDGTSVTLLQAMACHAPVVVSSTPGNRGWVTPGESGYLFTTGDLDDLAAQLRSALTSTPEQTAPITSTARERVEHEANWQANLPRLAQALRQG